MDQIDRTSSLCRTVTRRKSSLSNLNSKDCPCELMQISARFPSRVSFNDILLKCCSTAGTKNTPRCVVLICYILRRVTLQEVVDLCDARDIYASWSSSRASKPKSLCNTTTLLSASGFLAWTEPLLLCMIEFDGTHKYCHVSGMRQLRSYTTSVNCQSCDKSPRAKN